MFGPGGFLNRGDGSFIVLYRDHHRNFTVVACVITDAPFWCFLGGFGPIATAYVVTNTFFRMSFVVGGNGSDGGGGNKHIFAVVNVL